ncbi:MAG: SusD/RagB family nutrient-binding outer membrane lipoprotein [Bacteroidota bacterium]
MKNLKYIFLALVILASSCQDIVEDVNDNPNQITPEEVDARLFLTGAMLANIVAQNGHLNRIAALYSGQLTGFTSLYSNIYGYNLSTAESVTTWSRMYIGVVPNVRYIREQQPDNLQLQGICKVLEAHAIGTAASLFGDVPYSEIAGEIADPVFDPQMSVFNAVNDLLNQAISDLGAAGSAPLPEDIHFDGDSEKWQAVAYTLLARNLLLMKDYAGANAAAQNGIADAADNMLHVPRGDPAQSEGDKNLFWMILEGSRAGDIGTGNSYLMQLLNDTTDVYRGNAKTDETARFGFFTIDEASGTDNSGIIEQFEPMVMVGYQENQLTLAETAIRTQDFATALGHLNDYRAWLTEGGQLNDAFIDEPFMYEPYEAADFATGGMENPDGISADDALLREIIEERYISGFGTHMPFNDARRLRMTDPDLDVPFPFNIATATAHPERLPYSNDELLTNSNAPDEDPGIFVRTPVNSN